MHRLTVVLAALAIVFHAAGARGADEGARERSRASFRRGVALARDGNYAGARDAFAEAYRLYAHPSILLNLGIARSKTEEYVLAEEDLLHFLASEGMTPDEAGSARAALAEVRGHLATLHLRVRPPNAKVTLEGREAKLVNGRGEVRAVIGRRSIHAEAEGYASMDETVVVNQGGLTKEIVLARDDTHGTTPALANKVKPDDETQPSTFDMKKGVGWGLTGFGVLAAGAGAFCGIRAISLASDYGKTGDPETKSSGTTFRTLADVSFVVAAASAGVGVYLLLSPSKTTKASVSTRVVVGPNFGGIAGSF